jgi:hypothetical protein
MSSPGRGAALCGPAAGGAPGSAAAGAGGVGRVCGRPSGACWPVRGAPGAPGGRPGSPGCCARVGVPGGGVGRSPAGPGSRRGRGASPGAAGRGASCAAGPGPGPRPAGSWAAGLGPRSGRSPRRGPSASGWPGRRGRPLGGTSSTSPGVACATANGAMAAVSGLAMTADDSSINGMAALERSWDVRFMVVTRTLANMNIDNTKLPVWFRSGRCPEAGGAEKPPDALGIHGKITLRCLHPVRSHRTVSGGRVSCSGRMRASSSVSASTVSRV